MKALSEKATATRTLNDLLRTTSALRYGRVMLTRGISALPDATKQEVLRRIKTFTEFSDDNDPHGEHDFGKIEEAGHTVFFKIDYFDPKHEYGSEEPWDAAKTARVMTIMLAEEY